MVHADPVHCCEFCPVMLLFYSSRAQSVRGSLIGKYIVRQTFSISEFVQREGLA